MSWGKTESRGRREKKKKNSSHIKVSKNLEDFVKIRSETP